MLLVLNAFSVLGQPPDTPASVSIRNQIAVLEQEKAQLIQLQKDCAVPERDAARAAHQAIIDKLTALKGDPQATADIDAIFDELIARFQDSLKNFDEITPGRPCTIVGGAAARIAAINIQLGKLRALETR